MNRAGASFNIIFIFIFNYQDNSSARAVKSEFSSRSSLMSDDRHDHDPTTAAEPEEESDDEVIIRQLPFASGLSKKPIAFVPASDGNLVTSRTSVKPSQNIGDLYLSMVLPKHVPSTEPTEDQGTPETCPVCKLSLNAKPEAPSGGLEERKRHPDTVHQTSLAHQLCLAHSHPPSALDRTRMGLTYLESHGWDPDSRAGLGSAQQGISFPIKAKPKQDTHGIGLVVPKETPKKSEKPQQLDAGRVRKMAQVDKKKAERIQRQLYSNTDLEKYLGPGYGD
jgi:hypothetical protein